MNSISRTLTKYGYTLRSGGAAGADAAFKSGVVNRLYEIFFAEDATWAAIDEVNKVHPAPEHLTSYAEKLHGRNMMIIAGKDVNDPVFVDFVVCWTPKGSVQGGTATGIKYAELHAIPVYNLAIQGDLIKLKLLIMKIISNKVT